MSHYRCIVPLSRLANLRARLIGNDLGVKGGDPQAAGAAQELGEWSWRARIVRCDEELVRQRQQRDAENAEAHVGEGDENGVSEGLRELPNGHPGPTECEDLRP